MYYALGVLMMSLFGLSSAEVIGRFVFDYPLPWATEVCRFLLIWMIFLGASEVTRRHAHLVVGVSITRFVSDQTKRWIDIFTNACIAATLTIIVIYGIKVAYLSSHISAPASHIPMWWVWSAIPVNFSIMLFFILRNILFILVKKDLFVDDAMVVKEDPS